MAATNRIDLIDAALRVCNAPFLCVSYEKGTALRSPFFSTPLFTVHTQTQNSGRFDCQIYVPLPDLHTREEILKIHAKDIPVDGTVSFADIAAKTDGFSGADLAAVAKQAALSAMREDVFPPLPVRWTLSSLPARLAHLLLPSRRSTLWS